MKYRLLAILACIAGVLAITGCNKEKDIDSVEGTWEFSGQKFIIQMITGRTIEGSAQDIAKQMQDIFKNLPGYGGPEGDEGLEIDDLDFFPEGKVRLEFKPDGQLVLWMKEKDGTVWTEEGTGEYSYANGRLQIITEEIDEEGFSSREMITVDVKYLTNKHMILSFDATQMGIGDEMAGLLMLGIKSIACEITFDKV